MAHTYVISSVSSVGDYLTVVGTVDGVSVTVNTWVSAAPSLASAIAFRNFITPMMLAAVPQTPATYAILQGTFSQ
jgi:hypothetical protein